MLPAMTRTRIALTLSTLGLAGLLGLTGCGIGTGTTTAAVQAAADLSDEATALQAVGFDTGIAADPSPSASAGAESATPKKDRRIAIRKYLRKNTLHGEVTVQGKDGVKTIVVQRGTVTAVTSTSVSVKSTDGFALTWTFGDKLRVVQDKKAVQTSALKVGQEIGAAGARNGNAIDARLIAIK
jgi:hypothetical protein